MDNNVFGFVAERGEKGEFSEINIDRPEQQELTATEKECCDYAARAFLRLFLKHKENCKNEVAV